MKTLHSFRQLTKTYPNGTLGLRAVDLEIFEGEFLVVLGLSGSGKSTLLREIHLRTDSAMIFQQFNLIERHSVLSNVLYGAMGRTSTWRSLFGLWADEDRTRADAALRLVGITEKSFVRVGELSGGQKQRVAIARALVQGSPLLLADEPVASLDPTMSRTVLDALKKTNDTLGVTVICNLHDLLLAKQYATRIVALKDGAKIFDGPLSDIDEIWLTQIYGGGARGPAPL
jgi:phosphonate transport system ATP-binding protein